MKNIKLLSLILLISLFSIDSNACTNFLVTKGASVDGSNFITYAADSHIRYGELYFTPAAIIYNSCRVDEFGATSESRFSKSDLVFVDITDNLISVSWLRYVASDGVGAAVVDGSHIARIPVGSGGEV